MAVTYVDPDLPGITRKKVRNGWGYWDAKGARITDREEIDRLNAIALPPAYHDAWFCPSAHGHIQAIGYDDRGRKQYRYHADFRARQDAAKYDRCVDFGRALPLLRARVERDLTGGGDDRDTVVAAVVRLLDLGHIRVGNESYAKTNKSFGATTLRNRHAKVAGKRLDLQYRAKSGVMRKLSISDRSLSRVVRRVQDLPGQQLFQYRDDAGEVRGVGSAEVNAYIREAMGDDFTAKHFRTWSASVIALEALVEAAREERKLPLKAMLEPVAEALGNTPTMARKSYVHPAVIALAGSALDFTALPRKTRWLSGAERALIAQLDGKGLALSKAA
ncbi:MAG: DNA topoisomerase IB [Sphingomonadaceae bacterium]|nr:DNA topoisomerase IB [Sphingomonadaceae bacterium]